MTTKTRKRTLESKVYSYQQKIDEINAGYWERSMTRGYDRADSKMVTKRINPIMAEIAAYEAEIKSLIPVVANPLFPQVG